MDIKTYIDNRTMVEISGNDREPVLLRPGMQIECSIVSPEEEKRRQKRIKPEPPHHVFDIEIKPDTPAKFGEIPAAEYWFVAILFSHYSQFKKYWQYDRNKELIKLFTIPNYLRHHNISTRKDIERIKEISFLVGCTIGHEKGAEVDKLRPEVFEQLELYINSKPKTPQTPPAELKSIFSDSQNLIKLVVLLKERGFVNAEAGRLTWTGIEHERASGRGYQLIALSEVCRPLYVKNEYQAKELHSAWTSYFNFDIAVNNWQPSLKHKISDSYFNLFAFVRDSLKFN